MAAKLGVVEFFGGSPNVGYITAEVGYDTNHGRITSISGLIISLGTGTQSRVNAYEHQLSMLRSDALNVGWPTGTNTWTLTHSGIYPNNNIMNFGAASGFTVYNGVSASTFGR